MSSSLNPEVDINMIQKTIKLSNIKGGRRSITVDQGHIGIVIRGENISDAQEFWDIYVSGETIRLPLFDRNANAYVIFLLERIGEIKIFAQKEMLGISVDNNDPALVKFGFYIWIKDPVILSRVFPKSLYDFDNINIDQINTEIADTLDIQIQAMFNTPYITEMWTSQDIRATATLIHNHLNSSLSSFGLAISAPNYAYRKYPKPFFEIVHEIKCAERELLRSKNDVSIYRSNLSDLGISEGDVIQIDILSKKDGEGAGFYNKSISGDYPSINKFLEWLKDKNRNLLSAVRFIEETHPAPNQPSPNHPQAIDVALSDKVLRSAFSNPMLGLGEWEATPMELAEGYGTPGILDLVDKLRGLS